MYIDIGQFFNFVRQFEYIVSSDSSRSSSSSSSRRSSSSSSSSGSVNLNTSTSKTRFGRAPIDDIWWNGPALTGLHIFVPHSQKLFMDLLKLGKFPPKKIANRVVFRIYNWWIILLPYCFSKPDGSCSSLYLRPLPTRRRCWLLVGNRIRPSFRTKIGLPSKMKDKQKTIYGNQIGSSISLFPMSMCFLPFFRHVILICNHIYLWGSNTIISPSLMAATAATGLWARWKYRGHLTSGVTCRLASWRAVEYVDWLDCIKKCIHMHWETDIWYIYIYTCTKKTICSVTEMCWKEKVWKLGQSAPSPRDIMWHPPLSPWKQ